MAEELLVYKEKNGEIYHTSDAYGGYAECDESIHTEFRGFPPHIMLPELLCQKCLSIVADNPNRVRDISSEEQEH